MRKILQRIKDSYFKSLRGEESFWVVLLGWGVGVYLATISLTFCLISALSIDHIISRFLVSIFSPFGLVFVFIYPPMLTYSLFKTSKTFLNSSLSILFLFLATFVHFNLSKFLIAGSFLLARSSVVGCILGTTIVILTIKKTLSSLSTKTHK